MAFISTRTTARGTSYRVQWRHGGRQFVRTFITRPDAQKWATLLDTLGHEEALALLDDAPPPADMPTVSELVTSHIEALTGVTEGTRRKYAALQRLHIDTAVGTLPVNLLTHDRAAAWVNGLEKSGLSGKSIRNVHSLLSAAVTSGVRAGHIPENVVKGLRLPTSVVEEMVFLTPDEMGRFTSLVTEHYRPLVRLLFTSGLRFGEATALQVQDVDLQRATLRVRQAWKSTAGSGHQLGPPKSKRARRTIPVPDAVAADLARLVQGRGPGEFVFTNARGGPVRHAAFHSHVWTPAVHEFAGDVRAETGLRGRRRWAWDDSGAGKRPRIHDARHSFAAAAIAAGYSLTSLQRHLGHETIKTTSDTYGHVMPADRDAYASLVRLPDLPSALEA